MRSFFYPYRLFYLIACLLLLSYSPVLASDTDSLQHQLNKVPLQRKPQLLNRLFWSTIYQNRQQALDYAQEGLQIARRLKDERAEHGLLLCMATYYQTINERQEEVAYTLKSLRIARRLGDFEMAISELSLGETYIAYNNLNLAMEYLQSAISRVSSYDSIWFKAKIYHQMGKVYAQQKKLQEAEIYQLKALYLFNYLKNTHSTGWIHEHLSKIYLEGQQYAFAAQHLQRAEYFFSLHHNNHGLYNIHLTRGRLACALENYQEAIAAFDTAGDYLAILEENPSKEALLLLEKARVYLARQQHTAALSSANEAHLLLVAQSEEQLYLESVQLLADIHQHMGNTDEAIAFLQKGIGSVGQVDQQNKEIEFKNLSLIFQIERQNQETEILLQKAKLEKQADFQKVLLIAVSLCAVLIWLLLRAYINKRKFTRQLAHNNKSIEKHKYELIKVNDLLAHQNEVLQQINEEKESTIRVVTHDLKAPLNRIAGLLNLLRFSMPSASDDQQSYFRMIDQIIEEGSNTIHHLLDARVLAQEGIKLHFSTFSLDKLILETVEKYQGKANLKNVGIHIQPGCQQCIIRSDKYYLSRCLENLLSNAVKFCFQGKNVFIRWAVAEDRLKIEIEDEGPGIKSSEKQLLFKKYQRLTARPTGGESSVGLGLVIVKGVAEKLGGSIEFSHAPVHGAIFTLILPYEAEINRQKAHTVNEAK